MAQESNNNNNVRRCGQIGDGEDDELSMVDVLNEQTRLQADADAVLGGSDENNCTYPQGYIKRQALYACATCTPDGNAGICLACSYACHEGHDLYELYTKRYFTCDCGNEKFGGAGCKLYKGTKGLNADNHYNHNFKGLYCSCTRPYPDPEDTVEDEMIQCILCEDWYHGRHLKAPVPDSEDFHEMTCPGCMSKYAFLWAYYTSRPVKLCEDPGIASEKDIDVSGSSGTENHGLNKQPTEDCDIKSTESCQKDEETCSVTPDTIDYTIKKQDSLSPSLDPIRKRQTNDNNGIGSDEDAPSPKKVKLEADQMHQPTNEGTQSENDTSDQECILKSLQMRVVDCPDCAAFWPSGWRSKLCQCEGCLQMYKDRGVEFLFDESDTVRAYEEKGKDSLRSSMSDEDCTASALAGMNRVQQIEVVRGFIDLKTELNEFLHGFAQCGKVVTETDIREFFQRMDQRRKDRVHTSQYTCR